MCGTRTTAHASNEWPLFKWIPCILFFFSSAISMIQEANHSKIKKKIQSDDANELVSEQWLVPLRVCVCKRFSDVSCSTLKEQWMAIKEMSCFSYNFDFDRLHSYHIHINISLDNESIACVDKRLMGKHFQLKLKMTNEYPFHVRYVVIAPLIVCDFGEFLANAGVNLLFHHKWLHHEWKIRRNECLARIRVYNLFFDATKRKSVIPTGALNWTNSEEQQLTFWLSFTDFSMTPRFREISNFLFLSDVIYICIIESITENNSLECKIVDWCGHTRIPAKTITKICSHSELFSNSRNFYYLLSTIGARMLWMDSVWHIYIFCVEMCQFLQMNEMIDTRIYDNNP